MDLRSFSERGEAPPSRDDVFDAINHYSKFSNEQLMSELAKQLSIQRGKGKGDEITKTIEQIKPFLNADQQKRMEEILRNVGNKA